MPDPVQPVSPATQRWKEAAAELAPAKSYDRLVDNGRFVITTVSLVGVLITGFGLIGADRLSDDPGPRRLAAAAVALAVAAILLALQPLVARREDINLDNLAEVRDYYNAGLRRGKLITAAGWTLAAALCCAGASGSWAALAAADGPPVTAAAAVTFLADPKEPKVHATAAVTGLDPGGGVSVALTARDGRVLASGTVLADADGKAAWDETVAALPDVAAYSLSVRPDGEVAVTVSTGAS